MRTLGATLLVLVSLSLIACGQEVRLEGIDAPELKQAFGTASKQTLSDFVFGKTVRLQVTGKDRYQRTLGNVFAGQTWINLAMVERGFAWHFVKYSKDEKLRAAEARARAARLGLWRDAKPVAPWDWRPKKKPKAAP
jgi:endonuclease YncB( thermonuclease family)